MPINISTGSDIAKFAAQLREQDRSYGLHLGDQQMRQQQMAMQENGQMMDAYNRQQQFGLQSQNQNAQMALAYGKAADDSAQHWAGLGLKDAREKDWTDIRREQMQSGRDMNSERIDARAELVGNIMAVKRSIAASSQSAAMERKQLPFSIQDAKHIEQQESLIQSITNQIGPSLRPAEAQARIAEIEAGIMPIVESARKRKRESEAAPQAAQTRFNDSLVSNRDGDQYQMTPKGPEKIGRDGTDMVKSRHESRMSLTRKDADGKTIMPTKEEIDADVESAYALHRRINKPKPGEHALDDGVIDDEFSGIVERGQAMGMTPLQRRSAGTAQAILRTYGYVDKMPATQQEEFFKAIGDLTDRGEHGGKMLGSLTDETVERLQKRGRAPADFRSIGVRKVEDTPKAKEFIGKLDKDGSMYSKMMSNPDADNAPQAGGPQGGPDTVAKTFKGPVGALPKNWAGTPKEDAHAVITEMIRKYGSAEKIDNPEDMQKAQRAYAALRGE